MRKKYYIRVDGYNIKTINYIFTDSNNIDCLDEYSEAKSLPCGGESGTVIFEKHGIPEQYQRMYMVANPISIFFSMPTMTAREKISVFQRFKAKEILTDIPVYLTNDKIVPIFSGYMAVEKPPFNIECCYECNKENVLQFYNNLKKVGLWDQYLEALGEIMNIDIEKDLNGNKIKKYKNKNS